MDNLYLSLSGNHHAFLGESPRLLLQLASACLIGEELARNLICFFGLEKQALLPCPWMATRFLKEDFLPATFANKLSQKPLERVPGNWRPL